MLHTLLHYRLDLVAFAILCFGSMAAAHVWLRRSGRAAGVHPAAWLALAGCFAAGVVMSEVSGYKAREALREGMESFARTYALELQRMGHARINWDTPPDDPLYVEMIEAQAAWLRMNPGFNDIYTFRARPDGTVAFVVDSETDYDRDGRIVGEREGRTPIGETYPEADENMARALRGENVFDDRPDSDRWGTWVNAYVPLLDPSDPAGLAVEGAVGVDYDASVWCGAILTRRAARLGGASILAVIVTASVASVTALRAE